MEKINKKTIDKIKKEAEKYFKNASGCHDWSHVERVTTLAIKIGKKEKANLNILKLASILHDIGRKEEMEKKGLFCHAEKGSKEAKKILNKYKIDKKTIEEIAHCIISHRYRNNNEPASVEAKVLYDADKLDSIGAIGIGRIFLFAGNAGSNRLYTKNEEKISKSKRNYSYTKEDSPYLEYKIKLDKVKDRMFTREGKKIAKERHKFMKYFFKIFFKETDGNK